MNELEKSDEEIAHSVQLGDVESFGVLVDRYEKKLERYAKKFLQSREDTKDIVQEVFMKAYVNIKSFDIKRRFSPWIYRIAHNEFVNAVKRRLSERIFPFDLDEILPQPIAAEKTDSEAKRKELREVIDGYLEQLDVKYREPMVLYYIEEFDYKEIAEILQIPISTVGVRLQRGKMLLKKKLEHQA